jgi:hypothetical protein
MSKIDWSILGPSKKGLAVEGKVDKIVIEAFLDAGEKGGYWTDWRAQVRVEAAGSSQAVLQELTPVDNRIWGLIDRDWRTDTEVGDLQKRFHQLLILPRVTIENYCIDPDELSQMLPPARSMATLKADIESYKDDWIQNGALWQVMHDRGADNFCRGHLDGYPQALLHRPVTVDADIETQLQSWHVQLNPADIMSAYRTKIADFRSNTSSHYTRYIHGKNFFRQIVVGAILNPSLGPKTAEMWLDDLFSNVPMCPADIVPVLTQAVS